MHAARQPWSWLIFDVGQKAAMRQVAFLIFGVLVLGGCAHSRSSGLSSTELRQGIDRDRGQMERDAAYRRLEDQNARVGASR